MSISSYDKWLSTEPENGFIEWIEEVWNNISESEISADEYDEHEGFFDYYTNNLCIGTGHKFNVFVSPKFHAGFLIRKYRFMKINNYCELLYKTHPIKSN